MIKKRIHQRIKGGVYEEELVASSKAVLFVVRFCKELASREKKKKRYWI